MIRVQIDRYVICLYRNIRHTRDVYWCVLSPRNTILDEGGQPVTSDLFTGEVVVLDIGAYTLDALKFQDGNFDPESLEHATWENAGVKTHVWERLRSRLRKHDEDFSVITVDDIDAALRRGFASGDWTVTIAGKSVDLKPLCDRYFEEFADWAANNICDGVFDGFRGIKSVILVGGGAAMVAGKLRDIYPDKIIDQRKIAHLKKVHPGDLNAIGGLRLALRRVQNER